MPWRVGDAASLFNPKPGWKERGGCGISHETLWTELVKLFSPYACANAPFWYDVGPATGGEGEISQGSGAGCSPPHSYSELRSMCMLHLNLTFQEIMKMYLSNLETKLLGFIARFIILEF